MNSLTKRNVLRWIHLGVGSVIATYIYSPWGEVTTFQIFTKFVAVPLTVITGLWLWKGHFLRRFFNKQNNIRLGLIVLLCSAFVAMRFKPETQSKIILKINDVEQQGTLYVNFCTQPDEWSANGKYHYKFATPTKGTNIFTITNIPTGMYAVAIFQDNNGNGQLDENIFGVPKEPFAFSNNIIPKFSTPDFEDCKFQYAKDGQVLSINLLN
jgi:uncharacterized protein (DUF2141 family)